MQNEYVQPSLPNTFTFLKIHELNDTQRKEYDLEKKTYAILSQAIPREILHQFKRHKTSFSLWNALRERSEGNERTRAVRAEELKQQFNSFMHMGNESLGDIVTRYYHLLSEIDTYKIQVTMAKVVETLADALPSKWHPLVLILKQTNALAEMDLGTLIQRLQEMEIDDRRRKLKENVQQDPALYFATAPPPTQQPANASKLQTAYVSNTGSSSSSNNDNSSSIHDNPFKTSTESSKSQTSQSSQPNSSNKTTLQTDNLGKVTVEIA